MTPIRLLLSAGEASGDMYAARLAAEIQKRADVQIFGMGGPQMRAAGAFIKLDWPGHGTIETINSPVFLEGSDKRKPEPAPEIGAHTREVLRTLGYSDGAINDMIKRRIAAG